MHHRILHEPVDREHDVRALVADLLEQRVSGRRRDAVGEEVFAFDMEFMIAARAARAKFGPRPVREAMLADARTRSLFRQRAVAADLSASSASFELEIRPSVSAASWRVSS